jgi:alanine or glycine:cation symporter, AGCS family
MHVEMVLKVIHSIQEYVWGMPMIFLIIGAGLWFTIRLMGIQFRYMVYALRQVFFHKDTSSEGDITNFQSLMTSLSATIGIGNIVGVATAIAIGGVGSLLWMWVTALIGMSIKYSEALLAVKFRSVDENGRMCGGPMYYMEKGLGWKWCAIVYASLTAIAAFGAGNIVQVHSIAEVAREYGNISPTVTGGILVVVTLGLFIGGIKTLGRVASVLVPLMLILYVFVGGLIILLHYDKIGPVFSLIWTSGFSGQAAVGGFSGATMMMALRMGMARGTFSHEAGLGTAPIAAAAAKTDSPARQGLISMTATFFDTLVVCSITGIVIAITGVLGESEGIRGAALVVDAFEKGLAGTGSVVVVSVVLFAYSTLLGWSYYGEKCFQYLFGIEGVPLYRFLFAVVIFPAAIVGLRVAWALADISMALMIIPNLIALLFLSKVVVKETRLFFAQRK